MKRNTLRHIGHIEKIKNEVFVKKMYVNEIVGPNGRGKSFERWKDRVKECSQPGEVMALCFRYKIVW